MKSSIKIIVITLLLTVIGGGVHSQVIKSGHGKSKHKKLSRARLARSTNLEEQSLPTPLRSVIAGQDRKERKELESNALLQRIKIGSYFALWYALNVVYNITNKKVLNVLPAPFTVGAIQFGVGGLYAATMWLSRLRPTPELTNVGKEAVRKIGFYHCFGQILTMISLGSGPVSFTHLVKALEPFFSALVSALVFSRWMKPQVYASLIPVVFGVGYACLKELSFSWLAFYTAMASNVAFALRAVSSKAAMMNPIGTNISSANLFGLVTWAAFFCSIPVAWIAEGSSFPALWRAATQTMSSPWELVRGVVISGLFHYLNNEVMYLALSNVHPVTLAVGNTMKRVFIMVASVMVFQNPVSIQAGFGSAIGIAGVLLYSLTKQHYERLAQKKQ